MAEVQVSRYSGVTAATGAPGSLPNCASGQDRDASTTDIRQVPSRQGVAMQGGADEAVAAAVAGGHL